MSAEQGAPFSLAGNNLPVAPEETSAQHSLRHERSMQVAARLLAGAITFFFLSFAFAYVYLKTSNIEGKWRPAHVEPVQSWGVVFVVCLVISAIAIIVASRNEKAGKSSWLGGAIAALVFGALAIVAQVIEYTAQNFGPSNYAYASTFIAWTGFFILVALMSLYWIEIVVATEARSRSHPEEKVDDSAKGEDPDHIIYRGLHSAAFFWTYLVGTGVVMWVMVYLIK